MQANRESLSGRDRAYEFLRDHILTDPNMQGTFLNEQELAAQIGVSRTPVREALLLLVADGLVELIPKRGALIPTISGRQISELFELRNVLEKYAAGAAIGAGRVPLAEMAETLSQQAALVDSLEPDAATEFIRLDQHFHQLLIDAVGNELMSQTYSKLRARQVLIGVQALFRSQDRQNRVCEEHGLIVGALRDGNVPAATAAIDAHLAVTLDLFLRG
ncbi:DNA-binding GntR family transcriptional regulator [Arthrobacter silviterrae]|uniref:GntR family transcriptional regulator n=1 Tax=Arthrobacter silviterrae TaxID=2026658 RepID=A0ABX0DGA2_9MICC|nr:MULTISPECIES: GntR family transcriptional regulator [Arthrobacter]MCU6479853.1 GntR family transcriptional regulator [Arthrobacter sp. A2-55]MDQ0278664.1 DNA-binding GntR family transcriptional regulator [Arthrobacter silviterrae]NGN83358.1 GntR family transcriptional regulator [Arthrobacter silviterrae]